MNYDRYDIDEIQSGLNWEGKRVYLSGAFVSVPGGTNKKSNRFGEDSVICEYLVSNKATIRGKISRRLSKKDNILIVGKHPGAGKIERAKRWGIKIYTEKNMLIYMELEPVQYGFSDNDKDTTKPQSWIVIRDMRASP